MENVFITAVDNDAEPQSGTAEVQEMVSLKFRVVEIKYQPQDDTTGAAKGGSIDAKYDIAANA